MAIGTIPEIIAIGDISIYLAANDNAKGSLFGQRLAAPKSPVTIAMITDALRWGCEGGAQTTQSLRQVGNYLVWLCGKYWQQAQVIAGNVGGGTAIPAGSSGINFLFFIPITAADFSNATTYNDSRIAGKELQVFWNNINRYLEPNEFSQPVTGGITILIDGFDAQGLNSDAVFKILIVDPSGSNQTPTPSQNIRIV